MKELEPCNCNLECCAECVEREPKPTIRENWEERFDKEFDSDYVLASPELDECVGTMEQVKSFIRSETKPLTVEWPEEKKVPKQEGYAHLYEWHYGFNEARALCIKATKDAGYVESPSVGEIRKIIFSADLTKEERLEGIINHLKGEIRKIIFSADLTKSNFGTILHSSQKSGFGIRILTYR